jgi:hypothetical protein
MTRLRIAIRVPVGQSLRDIAALWLGVKTPASTASASTTIPLAAGMLT